MNAGDTVIDKDHMEAIITLCRVLCGERALPHGYHQLQVQDENISRPLHRGLKQLVPVYLCAKECSTIITFRSTSRGFEVIKRSLCSLSLYSSDRGGFFPRDGFKKN